jgi:hypothetical protein
MKGVDPRNHAAWTIKDLHQMLTTYAYEVYDTLDHPALGQSPREAFERSIAQTGNRSHRSIAYDRDFLIFMLPTTRKGTATVTVGRGMKINHLYYWSEHFRSPTWEAQQVPVRYDAFDIGTAYAFVNRQWVECHSEYYSVSSGRRERPGLLGAGPVGSRCKAWRETLKTIEWETGQVARSVTAIEEWHRKHPVQALALRTGLKKPPADLQRLEQTHAETVRFLKGSERRLAELEQAWPQKRLAYEQKLEREGEEIIKAKRYMGVIDAHPEHFQKFWLLENQSSHKTRERERRRGDRNRGGWSR